MSVPSTRLVSVTNDIISNHFVKIYLVSFQLLITLQSGRDLSLDNLAEPTNDTFIYDVTITGIMTKILIAIAASAVIGAVFLSLSLADQTMAANSDQKFRHTQTITSSSSPGIGHEGHRIAMILPPDEGAVYAGTLTYTASAPIDIVVLHEIEPRDSRGQPIWLIDDETVYGWTFIDASAKAGSFEYAGAGLLLHTTGEEFVVTVSVDGSIRGGQTTITLPHIP